MAIKDYKSARKSGVMDVATRQDAIDSAYLAARKEVAGTDDGKIDPFKFIEKDGAKKFADALTKGLIDWAKTAYKSELDADDDADDLRRLAYRMVGLIDPHKLAFDYIKDAGINESLTAFNAQHVSQDGLYGFVRGQELNALPQAKLDEKDAEKVAQEAGVEDRIYWKGLTTSEMAQILNEKEDNSRGVTDDWLKDNLERLLLGDDDAQA
jgi:hypothetical protein